MKTKFIQIRFDYDNEETWEVTYEEVQEMLKMFNNLRRTASIVSIRGDKNDDGQDEWTSRATSRNDCKEQ